MNNDSKIPYGVRKENILKGSEVDTRTRRYMIPQRILWKTEGVTGEQNLLKVSEKQIHFNVPDTCTLTSNSESAGILIDFGVEFHGYVKLFIQSVSAPRLKIRVRFGESAMEAMADIGEKNATNDHIDRDQIIDVGFLSMPEIGPSGFRFVRIDLLDKNAFIVFKSVVGIFIYRELEYKGSFRSNDELLNTIWNTGAYTVHLNMQEYVWDGIKRDRLVWIGDIHPETSTIQAVFGHDKCVENSLDLARDESPLPRMMCGISSYSLWWILVQYGWYMQNGNRSFLEEQRTYLVELLKFFMDYVDEDGAEKLPPARFLDWPSHGNDEAFHAGLQAIMCMAFKAGAYLCDDLGEKATADMCRNMVARMVKHVPDPNNNKQAAALLALSGIADPVKMNDEVISIDGAHRMSTFLGFYILKAKALAGDVSGALNVLREYWGGMLSRGATTFWEDFNLDWLEGSGRIDELVPEGVKDIHGDYGAFCYGGFRHSLCHGWASGPTAFLSETVLGIKPAAPGCSKITVKPDLGDLKWAEGTYPTPYGIISVRHEKDEKGNISSKIQVPQGVEIVKD